MDIRWLHVIGAVGLAALWAWAVTTEPSITGKPFGADAEAYYFAPWSDPYTGPEAGMPGAYLYSPAFLQVVAPLRLLPFDGFMALWLGASLIALGWLVTPLGALVLAAFPPITSELLIGNIHVFLAVALVVSVRHPSAWILALLTKPTLGVLLLHHRVKSWVRVSLLLATVMAVSALIAPDWWVGWFERLRGAESRGGVAWTAFLVIRLVVAGAMAWFLRPRWLPLAAYLALPIPWVEGLALLAAVPRLARDRRPEMDRERGLGDRHLEDRAHPVAVAVDGDRGGTRRDAVHP